MFFWSLSPLAIITLVLLPLLLLAGFVASLGVRPPLYLLPLYLLLILYYYGILTLGSLALAIVGFAATWRRMASAYSGQGIRSLSKVCRATGLGVFLAGLAPLIGWAVGIPLEYGAILVIAVLFTALVVAGGARVLVRVSKTLGAKE